MKINLIITVLLWPIIIMASEVDYYQSFLLQRQQKSNIVWSILICTLVEREQQFNFLYSKLSNQINRLHLEDSVEIIPFLDNRNYSIGFKRNELLKASQGKYICFIDDDDDIHANYIAMIYDCLLKNPDCVSLTGIITVDGRYPMKFIHSKQYTQWFDRNNIFYRPPNHLNPIKRDIAIQFSFPEMNFSEDYDWSMAICNARLIKTEEVITEPYYFYQYKRKK